MEIDLHAIKSVIQGRLYSSVLGTIPQTQGEALQASTGREWGLWGSVMSSLSRIPGGALAKNEFGAF